MKVSHKGKVYDVRATQTKETPDGSVKTVGYITSGGVFGVSEVEVLPAEEPPAEEPPATEDEGVSESADGPPKKTRSKKS